MNRQVTMSRVATVLGGAALGVLVALAGCGKATPCSGSNCYPIGGLYVVKYTPRIACPAWVTEQDYISYMTITESGSTMTMSLTPSAVSLSHTLNGQEDLNGQVSVTEPETGEALAIPYGEVNGAFTSLNNPAGSIPFQFIGTLQLVPTGANTQNDGGAIAGCSASYSINAQQQTDANGNPVGMGTTTDGG